MNVGREAILGAIRVALGRSVSEAPWDPAPTAHRPRGTLASRERLTRLEDRLREYRATVERCHASELPSTILRKLTSRNVGSLLVPQGLRKEWISGAVGEAVEIRVDSSSARLGKRAMASTDGVLTGCTLAIAETGTLILAGGPTEGRRALSLLPDYHLCVVFERQVMETVPEAFRRLRDRVEGAIPPLTLISGPSATSDIELVRVEGVHGPRTLDVILVAEE